MKSAGHGPPRAEADRRPPATTAPTIPPGGAICAGSWEITPGETAYPSPVSMGPVRRQPPPSTKASSLPCLAGRPGPAGVSGALVVQLKLPSRRCFSFRSPQRDKPQRRSQQRQRRVRVKIMMNGSEREEQLTHPAHHHPGGHLKIDPACRSDADGGKPDRPRGSSPS